MSIYLVEGERTVKQRVLFFVDGASRFDASKGCRDGEAIKEIVLEETQESKPTNFKHLGFLTQGIIDVDPYKLKEALYAKVHN